MKHLKTFENSILNIEEHDVVELKDGRIGTIVHIYPDKENFAIEIRETSESEVETINKSEIKEIL